jgi:hypothetical protein
MRSFLASIAILTAGCGGNGSAKSDSGASHVDAGAITDGAPADVATCSPACGPNATCTYPTAGPTCACDLGYSGDGQTCTASWSLEHTEPDAIEDFFSIDGLDPGIEGPNARIYFARQRPPNFFRSYDITAKTVQTETGMPSATDDFCACGAYGQLVTVFSKLYYIANYAQAYDPVAKSWASLTYPNAIGEAGTAVLGTSIYLVGGGTRASNYTSTVVTYDTNTAAWGTAPEYPISVEGAMAVTVGSTIYAYGGVDATNTAATDLYSLASGAQTWTKLANPGDLQATGMVGFRNQVWVYSYGSGQFHVFDPSTNSWMSQPVNGPAGIVGGRPVVAFDQLFVVGDDTTNTTTLFEKYTL